MVRMQAIADRAGVSRTLLHYHFASRDELLRQAFEYADAEVDRHVHELAAACETPGERLLCTLGAYLDDGPAVRTSWGVWLEMRRAAIYDPSLRPVVEASYGAWVEQVESILRECGLRSSASGAATRLCALVDGLGAQLLLGRLAPGDARHHLERAVAAEL